MIRIVCAAVLAAAVGTLAGCSPPVSKFEGPTVKEFHGKLVHNGQPVRFADGEEVTLKLFHEKGESFGVPVGPDGTFKIGWMPQGKFTATLTREKAAAGGKGKGGPNLYSLPANPLTIVDGTTDYTIELGKGFKL